VGAAGALAEDLAVGDLVLAGETVEHDYTERFSPHPLPRFAGDAALLDTPQRLPRATLPCRVHVGRIASGRGAFLWPLLDAFLTLPVTAQDFLAVGREGDAIERAGVADKSLHGE